MTYVALPILDIEIKAALEGMDALRAAGPLFPSRVRRGPEPKRLMPGSIRRQWS